MRTSGEVLYPVVPLTLLRRYLPPALRARVWQAVRRRAVVHPLVYRRDGSLKRGATGAAVTLNFFRKYHRHYPRPTSTGT